MLASLHICYIVSIETNNGGLINRNSFYAAVFVLLIFAMFWVAYTARVPTIPQTPPLNMMASNHQK